LNYSPVPASEEAGIGKPTRRGRHRQSTAH